MKKWMFVLLVAMTAMATGCMKETCNLPGEDPALRIKAAYEVHYPRSQSDKAIGQARFAAARVYVAPRMDPGTSLPVVPDLGGLKSMRVEKADPSKPFRVEAVEGNAFAFDVFPTGELFGAGSPASVPVELNVTLTDTKNAVYTEKVTVTFYPSLYILPVVTLKKSEMDADPDMWIRDYYYDLRDVLSGFGVTPGFFAAHPLYAAALSADGYGPLGPGEGAFVGFDLSKLDPREPETFKEAHVEDLILSSYPAGSYIAYMLITVTDPNTMTLMIGAEIRQEIRLLDE